MGCLAELLYIVAISLALYFCFISSGLSTDPVATGFLSCGLAVSIFIAIVGIKGVIQGGADKIYDSRMQELEGTEDNDNSADIECDDDDESNLPDEDFVLEIEAEIIRILQEGEHRNKCILLRECEALAKQLPGYSLSEHVIFKSWYKNWKEVIYEDPVLYAAHINNGNAPKEQDPYYDVNVKYDWSVFALEGDYSDLYDYDDEVDKFGNDKPLTREDLEDILDEKLEELAEKNSRGSLGRAASNGLALGIGIGLGNALTGGHGLGSSN